MLNLKRKTIDLIIRMERGLKKGEALNAEAESLNWELSDEQLEEREQHNKMMQKMAAEGVTIILTVIAFFGFVGLSIYSIVNNSFNALQ